MFTYTECPDCHGKQTVLELGHTPRTCNRCNGTGRECHREDVQEVAIHPADPEDGPPYFPFTSAGHTAFLRGWELADPDGFALAMPECNSGTEAQRNALAYAVDMAMQSAFPREVYVAECNPHIVGYIAHELWALGYRTPQPN